MINDSTTRHAPWEQTINTGDSDFFEKARLTSKIIKQDVQANGETLPGVKALMRLEDKHFYRTVPEDFEVLQPDEFYNLTTTIGGPVHSAGQTENGELVWFMTAPKDEQFRTFQVNNDIYANYILFALSYDSTIGIVILPISINLTRDLTYNVSEMLQVSRPSIRQSKNTKVRTKDDDFTNAYTSCLDQIVQFKGKLRTMSNTNGFDFNETIETLVPLPLKATENKKTRVLALRDDIASNHYSLNGTSLYSIFTAIYATDVKRHDKRRTNFARRFFTGKTSPLAVDAIKLLEVA